MVLLSCFLDRPEREAAIGSQTHGESESLAALGGEEGTSRWWPASKTPERSWKFLPAANQGSPVLALNRKTIIWPQVPTKILLSDRPQPGVGQIGPAGSRGDTGKDAPAIASWETDDLAFVAYPLLSDGRQGGASDSAPCFRNLTTRLTLSTTPSRSRRP